MILNRGEDEKMKYTGNDIRNHSFSRRMRGYDRLEVDAFLFKVADWLDQAAQKNEQLSLQCQDLFVQYNDLRKEHAHLQETLRAVNETKAQAAARAAEIREKAETEAGERTRAAAAEAERIRAAAEEDVAQLRGEVAALTARRERLLTETHEALLSQIQALEVQAARMGVDLVRLGPGGESENVIALNQKAEGDGA